MYLLSSASIPTLVYIACHTYIYNDQSQNYLPIYPAVNSPAQPSSSSIQYVAPSVERIWETIEAELRRTARKSSMRAATKVSGDGYAGQDSSVQF